MDMKFDVVVIGGGKAGAKVAASMLEQGKKVAVVSSGLSINNVSLKEIEEKGAVVFAGDTVTGGSFEGSKLVRVSTQKLREVSLEAKAFVLATGGFFSRGLYADMEKVYERALGLDVEFAADREQWFDADFSAPQPFLDFGVKVDQDGRAFKGGVVLENVYAAGEVLSGVNSVCEDAEQRIAESVEKVVNSLK